MFLFVVLLGTAHKRDARRDLFENVPVWRPPRHCRGNYRVNRFLRHRPRERRRELSYSSFLRRRLREREEWEDIGAKLFLFGIFAGIPARETCWRSFLFVIVPGLADGRDAGNDEESFVCLRLFLFVVLFGVTRGRDTGKYEDRFA